MAEVTKCGKKCLMPPNQTPVPSVKASLIIWRPGDCFGRCVTVASALPACCSCNSQEETSLIQRSFTKKLPKQVSPIWLNPAVDPMLPGLCTCAKRDEMWLAIYKAIPKGDSKDLEDSLPC
ncbi:hypothetical protein GOODEAATRI_001689 [Goodea atripinnis]|uniref:Uncharacterized protein n=1 Tax=Goodea atripinnis TaxID=208336 RepID=A0ABV0NRD4_9TELE